jgi:hypothetical protein
MKKTLALLASSAVAVCCGGASNTGLEAPPDGGANTTTTGNGGARGTPGTVVANGGTGAGGAAGAPGGSTSALSCGTASCVIPGESCCLTEAGGTFSFACVVGSSCPAAATDAGAGGNGNGQNGNTATLQCTSAANCAAGTVCCVSSPNNGATSECKTTCTGDVAQLCDPSASAATTGCAAAQPCSSKNIGDWGLPPTFGTCGGKGN